MDNLIYFICALLSALAYAIMNILDKFTIVHKAKNPLSFAVLAGFAQITYGVILALFLDWSNIHFSDLFYPIIAGVLLGIQIPIYYWILKEEDASNIVGIIYIYPLGVVLLSYLFLNEKLELLSYFGVLMVIFGAILLSTRFKKKNFKKIIYCLLIMIILTAIYEFLLKLITTNIKEENAIALNMIFLGFTIISILLSTKIRSGLKEEFKNIKYAFLIEAFTFMAVITLFVAMSKLPASIVSSVAAVQPLFVLLLERIMDFKFGKMCQDHLIMPKLIPIILIIVGVIILYIV